MIALLSDCVETEESRRWKRADAAAVKKAQEKVKALTGSSGKKKSRRAVATTCKEVITKVKLCKYRTLYLGIFNSAS